MAVKPVSLPASGPSVVVGWSWAKQGKWGQGRPHRAPGPTLSLPLQEHQTVVYQMIQQIQQKRELQRLQMAGGSQLPMASLLAGSSTPLLSAGTPGLLPAGALVAPSLGNNTSLLAAAAAAAAVAAAGGPPVLTAQTNPFLGLSGADGSSSGPKGGVSKESGVDRDESPDEHQMQQLGKAVPPPPP